MTYFLVDAEHLIVNIILWDGEAQYDPSPNRIVAQDEANSHLTIGDAIA